MSMKSASPSSLHILAQHNRSKSTVSSSDTDFDSAEYVSSSGTTTPEDDAQTFDLNHTCGSVLAERPKYAQREKLTTFAKSHNFASTLKRAKKVAYALVTFKRKRPDDISPILISSPLRERFGKRMSVKPQPDESFYSLPNRRFSFSDVRASQVSFSRPALSSSFSTQPRYGHHQYDSQTITRKFGTISGSGFARGTSKKRRSGLRIPSFSDRQQSNLVPTPTVGRTSPPAQQGPSRYRAMLIQILRVLLFVPWCAAVGGALILFPSYAEPITFRIGYIEPQQGLRRFAYWAECGQQHVAIFLACLVAVFWYHTALGLSLTSIAVSRFVFVWHAFKMDKSSPLGEDDQQSLYLIVTGLTSTHGSFITRGTMDEAMDEAMNDTTVDDN